jgi:phosphate uptake regulator
MWSELIEIFRGIDPMKKTAEEFMEMLRIAHEMAQLVRPHLFEHGMTLEHRSEIYNLDIRVNRLERSIRKRIISHLAIQKTHVTYCLLTMSLIKDVERIGDYVKNISEVCELEGTPVPEGALRKELEDIVGVAMNLFEETPHITTTQDRDRATELLQIGRNTGKRCDRLLVELSRSDFDAAQATSMVLLTRFYKRIGAHLMNVLSSVVMPLHKIDYFDEKVLESRE